MNASKAEKRLKEYDESIEWANGMFKNSPKLIEIYKSVIKDRTIELHGMKWPIDIFVAGTNDKDEKFEELYAEIRHTISNRAAELIQEGTTADEAMKYASRHVYDELEKVLIKIVREKERYEIKEGA